MHAVTNEDIARLHAYLVVPVVVSDLLNAAPVSAEGIEGETQYALHGCLSDLEPDSALLAIALGAQRIAADYYQTIPVAAALKMEADKIISEYGPEWLANFHNHPIQGDDLFELLCHVPEDLESLADLLETLQASLHDEGHPAYILCSILAIQARAHMDIADYVLSELENEAAAHARPFEEQENAQGNDGICHAATPHLTFNEPPGSNIVLFPIHRCR